MLLEELRKFKTVEEAAQAMAGNYKKWDHFMLFGEKEIPDNRNLVLGYLLNNLQGSILEAANAEVVFKGLEKYMADDLKAMDRLVTKVSSSFCGDRNAFEGVLMRVYDAEGKITKPFRMVYLAARHSSEDTPLNREVWKRHQREAIKDQVASELHFRVEVKGETVKGQPVPITEELVEKITDWYIEDDSLEEIDDEQFSQALADCVG